MKKFNTSGPNDPEKHYTIQRTDLIHEGIELIQDERYFTIWAPRQTGKSTYFRQLSGTINTMSYRSVYFSVEGFTDYSVADTFDTFCRELKTQQNIHWQIETFKDFEKTISENNNMKLVIIIDEIESLNPNIFGQFLHTIRNLYHNRKNHCLKSVILVGVTNILGVVSDNASPFNITDNLNIPYFTDEEVIKLLEQHEAATGQIFEEKAKQKISYITANQPGLVNGFAKKLVEDWPEKKLLSYDDYLKVEDWYLNEAIDKNFSNILNKAKEEREFVERLLFTDQKIPFKIDRPAIKMLHTNGLIKKDEDGYVSFWVPFYKKRLYDAFYPYTNGEQRLIRRTILAEDYFNEKDELKLHTLIETYKEYVKRRGFNPHREKDENGNYTSIREAALIYSFETYIHAIVNELGGKIYREAQTGLGKSDMIIHIRNNELLIETKVYTSPQRFVDGKKQLAYYCKSLNQVKGIYLVYCPNDIKYPANVIEQTETIDGVEINTYLIEYDEKTWH